MTLYQMWINKLKSGNKQQTSALVNAYYEKETGVYSEILKEKAETFSGTAEEFGAKYGLCEYEVGAFMEGINTSLETPVDMDTLEWNSHVELKIVWRELYKNMLKAKAEWLYTLPEWDNFYTEEERREITREFKLSRQAHVVKIGRNDPCPCGSGKKYKNCCGAE